VQKLIINKRWMILFTFLVVATLAGFYEIRKGTTMRDGETRTLLSERSSAASPAIDSPLPESPSGITVGEKPYTIVKTQVKWSAWSRNPFIPLDKPMDLTGSNTTSSGSAPLTLEGIIVGGEKPIAMINGKSLRKGDEIRGWKIIRIGRQKIYLYRGGERMRLDLAKKQGKLEER